MKLLSSIAFSILIAGSAIAQNRSISFIDQDFSKAKAEAKAQGKIIFVDAYTTWCGPCKWMAANKFTNDTIADFYNQNFVSLKMDMEKGEGLEMAKKYGIRSYPTLLFLDSEGKVVHRKVGASRKTRNYIDFGLTAMNPFERLSTFDQVWAQGNTDPAFVEEYLKLLQESGVSGNDEIVKAFYSNVSDADLMNEGTWKIIYNYDRTVDSKGMVNLLAKKTEYATLYGQDKVEERLYDNYLRYLYSKVYAKEFSMKEMELTMIDIKKKDIPYWQKIILLGDLAHLKKEKKYKDYCEVATDDIGEYFNEDANKLNEFAWNVFQWSKKEKELEIALGWAKRSLELNESAAVQDTYANLLYKLGRKDEARIAQQKAIDMIKTSGEDAEEYQKTLDSFK